MLFTEQGKGLTSIQEHHRLKGNITPAAHEPAYILDISHISVSVKDIYIYLIFF